VTAFRGPWRRQEQRQRAWRQRTQSYRASWAAHCCASRESRQRVMAAKPATAATLAAPPLAASMTAACACSSKFCGGFPPSFRQVSAAAASAAASMAVARVVASCGDRGLLRRRLSAAVASALAAGAAESKGPISSSFIASHHDCPKNVFFETNSELVRGNLGYKKKIPQQS